MGDRPHTTVVDDIPAGEIRFLGDVQRLQLGPDDVVVIRSPIVLTVEVTHRLREYLGEILGPERNVLILSGGLELGVLSPTGKVS